MLNKSGSNLNYLMGISDGGEYQIEYFEKCFTIAEFALDEIIVFGGEIGRKR